MSPAASPPAPPTAARPRFGFSRLRLTDRRVIGALLALLIAAALFWWWRSGRVSTDNAQIQGAVHPVSARISGQVIAVHVGDNEQVAAGQLLFELDERDSLVALQRAEADLAAARAGALAAEVGLPVASVSATSRLDVAEALLEAAATGVRLAGRQGEVARAQVASVDAALRESRVLAGQAARDLERLRPLAEKDEISRRELDAAQTAARAARARVERLEAEAMAAEREVEVAAERLAQARGQEERARAELEAAETAPQQIEVSRAEAAVATAHAEQAGAMVERARLDLEYTRVRAPAAGRITMKSVEVGQVVQPGRPVIAIVALEGVWVEAKFKETQLRRMRPGQRALVEVDAYPGTTLRARVESVAAATAGRFSLFPAENASGNFVKVVQRVPVKLVLEEPPAEDRPLRPGMSVVATVLVRSDVREARSEAGGAGAPEEASARAEGSGEADGDAASADASRESR
ncbi:MAG TPA: HlyD family secretion protein [Thermoanaerobaculia bacterium]|nr:HlyD family secretion protein [Thermoanaerobaculia bacterium]